MAFTYILKCADDTFYTGWTTELEQRVNAHNSGRGARYTRCRLPVRLVYWEIQPNRSEAQKREYVLRHLGHAEKELLVEKFNIQH